MKFLIHGLLVISLFAVPVFPAFAEDAADPSLKEEILKLQKMVLDLQRRIQQLEAERAKTDTKTPRIPEHAKQESRKKVQVQGAPRPPLNKIKTPSTPERVDTAAVGTDAPAPLQIGGRTVRVGIDGAIQLDVIHDFNAMGLTPGGSLQREFITAEIPVGGPASAITNRTAFSPNQSYLAGWAETDTPWGPLRIYADVNLMGSTTDAQFQIYKAYGQWGWLKAGLDYTLWLNQSAMPDTLDFEGPNALPEVRFAQASLKIPLQPNTEKKEFFVTVGVEDAAGDITTPSTPAGTTSVDQIPSVIGKLSYEPDWAHFELGGMFRRLRVEGPGYDQSLNGWGVTVSGSVDSWKNDNFIWGVQYGNALGAYIQDTSGLGLDAAPTSATNTDMKVIPAFGVWAAYQHWWTKSLRSSATYGFVHMDTDFDLYPNTPGAGTYKQTQYASANLIWSPWPPFDVGLEYLYGHRTVTDSTAVDGSTTGDDHRVQFTMRWNFNYER